jgi:hypothetical protein
MWQTTAIELRRLEESLWRVETRGDRTYMESVLADGFVEFGRSGRSYTRQQTIDAPVGEFETRLPLPDFVVRMISDEIALVTYRSEVQHDGAIEAGNRASLWRRRADGGWRLEFHQGTPADQ